jgi:hypothetical protein
MGRLLNPHRPRRRFRRRNPSGLSSLKGLLSKDILVVSAGAISASIGTGFIMGKFGGMLPGASNKYGNIAYQLAIPLGAAYLLRKKYKNFATGLAVGGVVMAITAVMKSGLVGGSAATVVQGPMGNFYAVKPMGLAGEIGRGTRTLGTYIGPKTYNTIPAAVNTPVFGAGAWG